MTGPTTITPAMLDRWPLPDHGDASSKHDRGTVLVIGGSVETPGALLLAGLAALRGGAGRLQVAVAAPVAPGLALALPEARVIGFEVDAAGVMAGPAPASLREAVAGADAVLVGPGLLTPEAAEPLLCCVVEELEHREGRLVVDAGALRLVGDRPDRLAPVAARTALIPNGGEAARLLDGDRDRVASDLGAALAEIVDKTQCTVAVRGAETWVGDRSGQSYVERSGPIGLATSGSGDVFAGLLAGYVARGADLLAAATWAAHVHAVAGRLCAVDHDTVGFLARELLDALPAAHRQAS